MITSFTPAILSSHRGVPRLARTIALLGTCLGGAALLLAGHASSEAATLLPAPLPYFAAYSWTGFYAGVQVGYDGDHDHLDELLTSTGVSTGNIYRYRPEGFAGGGHLGYDWQMGNVVVGAVTDFEGTTLRGSFLDPSGVGKGYDTLPWQGSVRGRLGYAFDTVMVYATGGFAYADLENTYTHVVAPANVSESFSNVVTGWTLGGGVDYAFSPHWIGFAEYRYSEYGRFKNNSVSAFAGLTAQQDYTANSMKVGVSYKF